MSVKIISAVAMIAVNIAKVIYEYHKAKKERKMNKYEAKLDFDTVVACRDALKIAKASFDSLKKSGYDFSTDKQYIGICEALEVIEKHL